MTVPHRPIPHWVLAEWYRLAGLDVPRRLMVPGEDGVRRAQAVRDRTTQQRRDEDAN